MADASPALDDAAAGALACWYAPWRHANPSWLQGPGDALGTTELARRLHYRLWCARLKLAVHPPRYDGSVWWQAVQLSSREFFKLSYLLGLALLAASDRRRSLALARLAAQRLQCGGEELRWALQRASWARLPVTGPWSQGAEPEQAGLLAVQAAVAQRMPALLGRIRLRYSRRLVAANEREGPADEVHADGVVFIEQFWQAAARRRAQGEASRGAARQAA